MTKITLVLNLVQKVNKQKGVIHLVLPLLLLLIAGAVVFVLFSTGLIKNPLKNLPFFSKVAKVSTKSEYKNPFKKETQYVNPFETYKNPFVVK